MDEKIAATIRNRARLQAIRYNFREYADDIAQDVVAHYLEGKGKHQTVSQAVIDIIRKRFGDTRCDRKAWKSFNNASPIANIDTFADFRNKQDFDFDRLLSFLKNREQRIIVCLHFIYGVTNRELAYIFGIHESNMNERIGNALDAMRGKIDESKSKSS